MFPAHQSQHQRRFGGSWFAVRRKHLAELVRPIYVERGIVTWDDATLEPVEAARIK